MSVSTRGFWFFFFLFTVPSLMQVVHREMLLV
jgi:hypothetical protein